MVLGAQYVTVPSMYTKWGNRVGQSSSTHITSILRYLTKSMGKYAFGSCGASGARSGTQRLNGVGGVGGSDDAEYAWRAALIVPIASERSTSCEGVGVAGTEEASGPCGATSLRARDKVRGG